MKSLLCAPDSYGTRWSYDGTIRVVREINFTYVVHDQIARSTVRCRTLPEARLVVREILDARSQLAWRPWHRNGPPVRIGTRWTIESTDGNAAIWIERSKDRWWSAEIDVNRNVEGGMRSYGWQTEGHHPIGMIQAQTMAWAAACVVDQRTP